MKEGWESMRLMLLVILMVFTVDIFACSHKELDPRIREVRIYRLFLEVEDGDTIIYRGTHMRFLGVDTPEIRNSELGFYRDQPYGREAKNFTRRQIRAAKRLTYRADGYDRYGRLLVHLYVDGYPLSLKIVEAGLGYETVSHYGDNGFPEISEMILKAAQRHNNLPFEEPCVWRARNRM